MNGSPTRPGAGYRLVQRLLLAFFRTFYLLEIKGLEYLPLAGPVVLCANHVNVFDALMLAACVPRRLRFVAWNKTFTMPAIGWFMRASGCIPVDREKPDPAAFKESLRWLGAHQVLGIFPEGRYTTDGHLMPVKQGTARMALAAGATVVPATITGAYRSWPQVGAAKRLLPRPWAITIKFHPPIHPPAEVPAGPALKLAAQRLTDRLAIAINSSLEPALRAEQRVDRLVEQPAPHFRIYEWVLPLVLLAPRRWDALVIALLYVAYLVADVYWLRQSRLTRLVRNFLPLPVLVAAAPSFGSLIGPLPPGEPGRGSGTFSQVAHVLAWVAVDWWFFCYVFVLPYLFWALLHYYFRHYLQFQRYLRGFLVTLYLTLLELVALPFMRREYPLAIGPEYRGLYVRFLEWLNPVQQARLFLLPSLFIAFSAYTVAFDYAHNRPRFRRLWFVVLNAWFSALVLRGYPLYCLAVNLLTVGLVYVHLNVFKFRAHDGRRI